MNIKFSIPNIFNNDLNLVKKIIMSGWLVHGKYTLLFEEEIKFLGSSDPIIIAFGSICYKFLLENLSSEYNIFKITHYAHFINLNKYRQEIKELIDSLLKTDLKKHLF